METDRNIQDNILQVQRRTANRTSPVNRTIKSVYLKYPKAKERDCMGLLIFICAVYVIVQLIKEACEPTIPADHWNNWDLIHQDRAKGNSQKEFEKNLRNGKYK